MIIMDFSMTFESTYKLILKRYREETGVSSAVRIDWDILIIDIPTNTMES